MWKICSKIDMYFKNLLLCLFLVFSACSTKSYKHVKSKILIIKTKNLKFADLAYLRNTKNDIELELFIAGKVIKRIDINNFICVDNGCMKKSRFNREYLSEYYPDNLFQNIILGKKIYNSKNLVYINGGFQQNIESKNVDIKYVVNLKGVYFKDRKNKILFKIKDVK